MRKNTKLEDGIMEFKREEYLSKLVSHTGNHMIKILTGIRRCGKSYPLDKIFYKHLLENGVKPKNIIKFAFDLDDIDELDSSYPEPSGKNSRNHHFPWRLADQRI